MWWYDAWCISVVVKQSDVVVRSSGRVALRCGSGGVPLRLLELCYCGVLCCCGVVSFKTRGLNVCWANVLVP